MKTYQVEMKRTSYIITTVEANSPEEAEEIAWNELEANICDISDADWELESITLEGETPTT